jgi:Ulp1 family protease
LFLEYPFDVDEELLRKASRGLLELGGDSLGVVPILDNQPDEDVTRVTRIPLRTHYVIIRENDYKRLSPGQLLNDALVDFWMRW